ncbi:hypothetical protein [Celeribacter litoreus]|nr:hypothetical protein [Celeribacter litoreus]MCA0043788.1 hypothetical protein [Celeribacter litoreus]
MALLRWGVPLLLACGLSGCGVAYTGVKTGVKATTTVVGTTADVVF